MVQKIGGGLNFNRKQFLILLGRIQRGEIEKLLVAHKDRRMRFGFEMFAHIAAKNGCEIVVVNNESLSPQQEMVEDLMTIVHKERSRYASRHDGKQCLRCFGGGWNDKGGNNERCGQRYPDLQSRGNGQGP